MKYINKASLFKYLIYTFYIYQDLNYVSEKNQLSTSTYIFNMKQYSLYNKYEKK